MICLYKIGNEAFDKNGDAVMLPTKCTVTEEAGGAYECEMEHQLDGSEYLSWLVPGAIIKVPVPVATIKGGASGGDFDVYKVTAAADMQEEPEDAWIPIYYSAWSSQTAYNNGYGAGSKVTYSGHNYECTYWRSDDASRVNNPAYSSWWKRIADTRSSGVATLVKLEAGDELYFMEEESSAWYQMQTMNGIIGYVRTNRMVYDRHEHVDPLPERTVTDQLFRIYNVIANTSKHRIEVAARHVSYDLSGILIGSDCDLKLVSPAVAITRIRSELMMEYRGTIATNLTKDENGTYTGDMSLKNATFALLDPDRGIVPYFRAQYYRDNWDLFLMKNDVVDRGVTIGYGLNMKGVQYTRSSEDFATRIVPIAKASDGKDLFLPEMWIDSENIDSYPVIIMEQLRVEGQVGKDDGTGKNHKWTQEELLEEMRTKAGERFSVDHCDAIVTQVDVDFILLGDTEEYKQYKGMQKLFMYDQVTVKDGDIGLGIKLQVSYFEWDAILKRYNKIRLGNVFDYGGRTVTGYQIGDGAILYEKISRESIDRIISEAKQ